MPEKTTDRDDGVPVKMSILARRSGVPASTIKHYMREGLLPGPVRRSRNMALYDPAVIPRIHAIKELQRTRFLPLAEIKQLLDDEGPIQSDLQAANAISRVLTRTAEAESRTRAQLLESGMPADQLDWLLAAGLVEGDGKGDEMVFTGDDLALLQTLGASRRAGLSPDMLPLEILQTYLAAIRTLVRAELQMFRAGVLPRAGDDLAELSEVATVLSERLVVLIRRKMLLPTLTEIMAEERSTAANDDQD